MGHSIVKVDDDLWCVWSSVVDNVVMTGTRQEVYDLKLRDEIEHVRKRLDEDFARVENDEFIVRGSVRERLRRPHGDLLVSNARSDPGKGHYYVLPVTHFAAYVRAFHAENYAEAESLLEVHSDE